GVVEVQLGAGWRTGTPGRPEPLDRDNRPALEPPQHELAGDPLQRHRGLVRGHRQYRSHQSRSSVTVRTTFPDFCSVSTYRAASTTASSAYPRSLTCRY